MVTFKRPSNCAKQIIVITGSVLEKFSSPKNIMSSSVKKFQKL
jgi:hypothetical protein